MKQTFVIILIFISNLIYGQVPNELTNAEKIYGLSKFWQEVNYNFVYLNKVDKTEWNNQYKMLITEVQNTANDYEYYRLLQKFCATLNDGHTNVWFPKEIQDKILNTDFGEFKFILSNIDGKAIITKVNKSKLSELPIGTEIIKVNGIPTKEYVNQNVKPYISSSTQHILNDLSIKYMLEGFIGSKFQLELRLPNGKIKTINLTHKESAEQELYPEEKNELFEFKWINDEIAYIALNSFSSWEIMDLFSEKFQEIQKAKKLIIDLRKNGGGEGNIGREIIKYLTNDTILYSSKSKSRLHIPTYKAWGKYTKAQDTLRGDWQKQSYLSYQDEFYYNFPYEPYSTSNLDITRVELPTAILIGHNTASAAEDFLIYADNQENITKIGEPTFGSTGQPMIFDLPNGGFGRVCTKKDTYPDGREFVGFGIKPDIEIKTTLKDYMENNDPVLEKAVEHLNEK
ncbi:S41 family peptidase [Mesonia sp. HuA40]|uniref:S41 family peptidase n=1 Tax=Mesonia sp. HuA40 TaxID=2602761 RepID=UPI0011C80C66|nr:S41 family peptidase [Mesonia sp. HuA40]TXK70638.1 peptidase S41 [Mesonia sp. HuA40]